MSCRGLVLGSFALTSGLAARHKVGVESASGTAVAAVDAIGALLHGQNLAEFRRIAAFVDEQSTPGAAQAYGEHLKAAIRGIEAEVEPKIKEAHSKVQDELDAKLKAVQAADEAIKETKQATNQQADAWFACVAEQKTHQHEIEDTTEKMNAAVDAAEKACKAEQEARYFPWSKPQEMKFELACDFGRKGCPPKMASFKADADKMTQQADAAMKESAQKFAELKAACQQRNREAAQAQAAKQAADKAWAQTELTCKELGQARDKAICQYGHQMQEKCILETAYTDFNAATFVKSQHYNRLDPRQLVASDSADSEPDRMDEWHSTHIIKCLLNRAAEKGLDHSVKAEDLQACTDSVNYEEHVGKLNRNKDAFDQVAGACGADQQVVFGNGKTWEVPEGQPAAAAYTEKDLQLAYYPAKGRHPFEICEAEGLRDQIGEMAVMKIWPFNMR